MIEDYLRKNEIAYFLKNVVSFIRFWLNLNRIYKYAQRLTRNRISSHVSFSIIIFPKSQTKKCATKFKLRIFVTKTVSYTFPM